MKSKPLLVAVAAFVIVLVGGAAMAGIGIQFQAGSDAASKPGSDIPETTVTTETPKPALTTTTAVPKPESKVEAPSSDEAKEESENPKQEEDKTKPEADEKQGRAFTLDYPANESHVKSKVVAFGGAASEGTTVYRGKYEATPQEGKWSMTLVLSPGKNRVVFEAIDGEGRSAVSAVTVYYDAPDEDKKKDKSDDAEATFTAIQKYGSCAEVVPYDVFYGTAKPGATISASSAYGSNSTKANDKGEWEMKVVFPDAPSGETFNVTIKASTGQSKTFTFTNTGGGDK